jgi:murein DD-endopeptidase MepM/ murein hydrolase activator NlpD
VSRLLLAALLAAALPLIVAATSGTSPAPTSTSVAPSPTASPTPIPSPSPTPTPTPTASISPSPTPSSPPAASPSPTPSSATSASAAQQLIEQARQELGGSLADSLAAVQQLSDALNRNSSERDQIQQRIQDSQDRADALRRDVDRLDADIDTTQRKIEGERAQIAVLARELYQQPASLLMRLLAAGSVRDMVTRTSDLTAAALEADATKQQLTQDLERLHRDQAQRQSDLAAEAQVQTQLSSAMTQFQSLADAEQATSDRLQGVIDESQSALDGAASGTASLTKQVADLLRQRQMQLIAIAEQQVWQQEQLWARLNQSLIPPPVAVTTGAEAPLSGAGRFAYPIQGATLTQGFGPSSLALEPAMFGFPHFHTGLDLASPNPTITAAADGVVAVVGSGTTGYGNYVIIIHRDGFVTLYGHLTLATVTAGQQVVRGQQIGIEGSTGASTGVHLHFEVRLNGTPVDPTPYLPSGGTA